VELKLQILQEGLGSAGAGGNKSHLADLRNEDQITSKWLGQASCLPGDSRDGYPNLSNSHSLVTQDEGNFLMLGKFAVIQEFDFAPFEQHGFDNFIDGIIHDVSAAGVFDHF